jgi:hypothetical protein
VAALAQGAASLFCFGSVGVFVLRAALAGLGDLVDPGLNISNLEPIESLGSDARDDVDPDESFVSLRG